MLNDDGPDADAIGRGLRRRALALASVNAALWAIGNGLVSTTLVIYLANDLGARGLAISLILAAPHFAGLLRLSTPALIDWVRSRRIVCLGAFLASAATICTVPLAAVPKLFPASGAALAALVSAWCVYHLLEYIGVVALWSWLGDLTPRRIRGTMLGQRERWLVLGRVGGLAASAGLAAVWHWWLPTAARWQPLALSSAVGALLMAVAVVPLAYMPAVEYSRNAAPRVAWRALVATLLDPRYRRLITFYGWFSFINGITGAAQELFPVRVLGIKYSSRQVLNGMLFAGQSALAPAAGRLTDRFGNRPIMMVSQMIVATGLLFFMFATPERWWPFAGAYVVWIAYVGLNVGLDNIKLKLAPREDRAAYLASFYAVSDLAYGVATVLGGLLFDRLITGGQDALALYTKLFLVGWLGRTLAVALLWRLEEPGAVRLRELLAR